MRTHRLFSCCQFITQDISLTNCSPESIVDQLHTNTNKTPQLSPTTCVMLAWFHKPATDNRPLVASSLNWPADCSVEIRSLSEDWILRWCQAATTASHCGVQRRVVLWVRCNIIALATTAWLESLYQWGRVVVVVHCSAVECDVRPSQRPIHDLCCPMTSVQAPWHQWMNVGNTRPLTSTSLTYKHVHKCRHLVNWI